MHDDNCNELGCINPFHDHTEREALPPAADLIDTEDPAFPTVARVLADMRDAGADLTPDAVRLAVKLGRHYHGRTQTPADLINFQWGGNLNQPVVYYMRFGHLIKIGTSAHFIQRFFTLRPDAVLAIEPGTYDTERKRHRQFARFRSHNELFFPAPPLMLHVRSVQREHGKPKVGTTAPRRPRNATAGKAVQTIF